jgi:Ca2+-binding RTX toxin-like protein
VVLGQGSGTFASKVGNVNTITVSASEFYNALNSSNPNTINLIGERISHEFAHILVKGGYSSAKRAISPTKFELIEISNEAVAYTSQYLVARELGTDMSSTSSATYNALLGFETTYGSKTPQFYSSAYSWLKANVPTWQPSTAPNLTYQSYDKYQWALSVAGVDLSKIHWSSISSTNFTISDTNPMSWSFSASNIITDGGTISISGTVNLNKTGQSVKFVETGTGPNGAFSITARKIGKGNGVITPIDESFDFQSKIIVSVSSVDANGNATFVYSDGSTEQIHVQPSDSEAAFASFASTFGSSLGRLLGGSDLIIGTLAGSVLSAAAMSIGQQLFHVNYFPDGSVGGVKVVGANSVWADFGNNLSQFGKNAAIGAVSSYLAAEFAQSIGLHGVAGDVFSLSTGSILGYVATQVASGASINGALAGLNSASFGGTLGLAVSTYVGQKLASLVVAPHTVAESTLSSLGAAVGAYYFGVVGAFVGSIVGTLIGSLFGHHKPRIPTAFAETVLQIPYAQYGVGNESASNGGDLGFADSMAKAARDTLNGIIEQVTGKPIGAAFVANGYSPTQAYGFSGSQIYVKLNGAQQNVSSADQAVDKGVLWALPQTQIIGGDIFLKRAIQNGHWGSISELLGDLQIASDYEDYLKNQPIIDASIGSSWNSLSQVDKDFYTANQAFMTRALSMAQLPLQGGDPGFYNANKTQVDRIIAATNVSTSAAGWITTIARAAELKLDQFGPSDFYGGMAGFLQSFGVAAANTAEHYEDFSIGRHGDGSVSITAKGDASTGTFSLLAQKLDGPSGNDVYNPRFQQGNAGWQMATNYGPVNSGVDLPGWSGSGNDVLWSTMGGTPAGGLVDFRSDYMPSTAGHLYEASVWAAQHRGSAHLWIEFDDINHNTISYADMGGGGRSYGSGAGDLNNYDLFQGSAVAPAGTAYRRLLLRNESNGGGDPYAFFTRPESHDVTTAQDLWNPRFLNRNVGWYLGTYDANADWGSNLNSDWFGNGNDVAYVHIQGASAQDSIADLVTNRLGAVGGQQYQFSVLAAQHRGTVEIIVEWFDVNGSTVSYTTIPGSARDYGGQYGDPANFNRISGLVTAPAGAAYREVRMRLWGHGGSDPYAFFTQPIFRPATGGYVQSWSDMSSDYTIGGAANWDVTGQSVRIANFAASVGYNNNGYYSTGNDILDYSGATSNLDLNDAYAGAEGGDDIFLGGSGNDFLAGQSGADWLDGGAGNDNMQGNSGDDVLIGGAGNDVMQGDTGNDYLSGGDGNDTLYGGWGDDTLVGGGGTDIVNGEWGDDTLIVDPDGGGWADTLNGGDGSDTASFERFTYGVYIDISGQGNSDGVTVRAAGDALQPDWSIASPDGRYTFIYQYDGNLVLYGPSGVMWATNIYGYSAGRTVMQGDGNLVVYNAANAAVWASNTMGSGGAYLALDNTGQLSIQTNDTTIVWRVGGGGTAAGTYRTVFSDTWISIENITGSNLNDALIGPNGGTVLRGLGGDDNLVGGAGNDVLEGGEGADSLNGNGGTNTTSYVGSAEGVYVNLATGTAAGGDATGDTFANIQNITGSAYGDELGGTVAANVIQAGAGDDWIDGSDGSDVNNGGDGFDTLDFSRTVLAGVAIDLAYDRATLTRSDWSQVTQSIAGIERFIGTSGNDSFSSSGTTYNVTFDGNGGDDYFYGGTGSDTYVYGRSYGNLTVYDNNSGSNVIEISVGVTFNDIWAWNDYGTLRFGIRGEAGQLSVVNNFSSGNDLIKTLDLAGSQVDLTQLDGGNALTDGNDYFTGNSIYSSIIFGYGGDDIIYPASYQYSTKGAIVAGGTGNDSISTSVGDDQFLYERGDGVDSIADAGGSNTIVFGSTVAADDVIYEVVGNNIWVGLKDLNNASLTASQVADRIFISNGAIINEDLDTGKVAYSTAFSVQAGGATTDLTKANLPWVYNYWHSQYGGGGGGGGGGGPLPPIVLDLTGEGLQLAPVHSSNIVSVDAAGNMFRTAWVGPTNGILAYDRNGDGALNDSRDISFIGDKPGATTDLEGLSGWDTNGDGILDRSDENFSKLLVWVDRNVDGRVAAGEALGLETMGITSISLKGAPTGFDDSDTFDSVVHNTTSFTWADGSTGTAYDVSLARELMNGAPAVAADPDVDLSAPVMLGELSGVTPDSALKGGATALGGSNKLSLNGADGVTADFSTAGNGSSISAAAAAMWADYLDPAKIAQRRAAAANGNSSVDSATIATAADTVGALVGRASAQPAARLQTLVVDFNHDGPSLVDPQASSVAIDVARNGTAATIGWIAAGDAILGYDRNGDGLLDPASEVSFVGALPNTRTALQGVAAFDVDRNGAIDGQDTSFGSFLLWRDANGDGVSDRGEVQTLAKAGVTSIQLSGAEVRPDFGRNDGNDVLGVSSVTFADGTTGGIYDVALGFKDGGQDETTSALPDAQANPVDEIGVSSAPLSADVSQTALQRAPSDTVGTSSSQTVSTGRGALDGPTGGIVSADSAGSSSIEWWRDPLVVGNTLAQLGVPLAISGQNLAGRTAGVAAAGPDAAAIQRQQLLRQSLAAFQAPNAGSPAIWLRDASNDGLPVLASNAARVPIAPSGATLGA